MGYHVAKIHKGEFGTFAKIQEEYEEARDALTQNCPVMVLVELSDLIGAIEGYAKAYNVTLEDLIKMKDLTKSAFEDGSRKGFVVDFETFQPKSVYKTRYVNYWTLDDIKVNTKVYNVDNREMFIRYSDFDGSWFLVYNGEEWSNRFTKFNMVNYLNINGYTK